MVSHSQISISSTALDGVAKESMVDVLIIGAGPAGVMAGNALVKAGLSVRIIDKRSAKVDVGQADGVQPRTIEVFRSYGLADRLFKEGNLLYTSAFYDPTPDGGIMRSSRAARNMKGQEYNISASRYTHSVTLHQGDIEAIFVDSMRESGVDVELSRQPSSMVISEDEHVIDSLDSYPVEVAIYSLDALDGSQATELVRAKYVIGCDGAHSWVRKQIGYTMDGEQSNYVWGVVDCEAVTNFPDIRNRCLIHSHYGSMMIIPRERDIVRFYTQLSEMDAQEVINVSGRVDLTKWTPAKLLKICKQQLNPYDIEIPEENIIWWTLYIIGQRVASGYSKKDRVFIAGDACHTHSPKAGQGMNASMNDTHNLAWKLAYVVRGWAERSLLQTYEHERRKYAQDLIDFDKKWATLFSGKPRTAENQGGVTPEEMLSAYKTFSGFASGTGICYPPSPITQTGSQHLAPNMHIGTRMPPLVIVRAADARPFDLQELIVSDTRFKFFIFTGDLRDEVQKARLDSFVANATSPSGFLTKYGRRREDGTGLQWEATFEIFSILKDTKENVEFTVVPPVMRPHWSSVFVDDLSVSGKEGGNTYELFGISEKGAIAVVRPDGYVGMLAPLDCCREIDAYFSGFMKPVA